jgi:hypothetical protein
MNSSTLASLPRPAGRPALDAKDRRMVLIILGLVVTLLVLLAIFTPAEDPNTNPVPNSYLSGKHGAKAAYTLLERSGYSIEHWEQPLSQLALHADSSTVLVLAEPFPSEKDDRRAVATILRKGGRVLATGLEGGLLLPGNAVTEAKSVAFAACEAQPEGLQPLAGSASSTSAIWIVPRYTWKEDSEARTAYTCAGQPIVVELPVGQGHAIWWASSTPLENGSIQRGQNLELLLNSIGPVQNHHIYWDESLHGRVQTPWDFVGGPVWPLLSFGVIGLVLLTVFSFSRRSGPVRPLPQAPRTTPIEFLDALGALYRSTGATSTALQIAWERFRTQAALLTGQRNLKLSASEVAANIERRFGAAAAGMEADLIAAEEACSDETLKARRALELVRALRRHEETLRQATKAGAPSSAQFHRA